MPGKMLEAYLKLWMTSVFKLEKLIKYLLLFDMIVSCAWFKDISSLKSSNSKYYEQVAPFFNQCIRRNGGGAGVVNSFCTALKKLPGVHIDVSFLKGVYSLAKSNINATCWFSNWLFTVGSNALTTW